MCNKKLFTALIFFLIIAIGSQAQDCKISIKGQVFDEASQLPLSYVTVFVQETAKGTISDDEGKFSLDSLCGAKALHSER